MPVNTDIFYLTQNRSGGATGAKTAEKRLTAVRREADEVPEGNRRRHYGENTL